MLSHLPTIGLTRALHNRNFTTSFQIYQTSPSHSTSIPSYHPKNVLQLRRKYVAMGTRRPSRRRADQRRVHLPGSKSLLLQGPSHRESSPNCVLPPHLPHRVIVILAAYPHSHFHHNQPPPKQHRRPILTITCPYSGCPPRTTRMMSSILLASTRKVRHQRSSGKIPAIGPKHTHTLRLTLGTRDTIHQHQSISPTSQTYLNTTTTHK